MCRLPTFTSVSPSLSVFPSLRSGNFDEKIPEHHGMASRRVPPAATPRPAAMCWTAQIAAKVLRIVDPESDFGSLFVQLLRDQSP